MRAFENKITIENMAIRKSKEENFEVNGTIEDWKTKVEKALEIGEFTSIKSNNILNQINANYKKLTVWGEISVTLTENVQICKHKKEKKGHFSAMT